MGSVAISSTTAIELACPRSPALNNPVHLRGNHIGAVVAVGEYINNIEYLERADRHRCGDNSNSRSQERQRDREKRLIFISRRLLAPLQAVRQECLSTPPRDHHAKASEHPDRYHDDRQIVCRRVDDHACGCARELGSSIAALDKCLFAANWAGDSHT